LHSWLYDQRGGDDFLTKNENAESFIYEPEFNHDLLTLSSLSKQPWENDPFIRLLHKRYIHWYHILFGRHLNNKSRIIDEESQTVRYSGSLTEKLASLTMTVLSCIFPISAMVFLNHWKSTQTRIYIAVGIIAAFAFILVLFTNARRVEIFAATTALVDICML